MKKFYNNTINSLALKNALRVFALLCVLLGFSSSAWGAYYIEGDSYIVSQKTEMVTSGTEHTYTFTSEHTDASGKWFKIYNGNTQLGYNSDNFTITLGTTYTCTNRYTEFKLPLESGATYVIKITNDKKLTVTKEVIDYTKRTVYFDNTLGWSNVYAYLDWYWDTYNDPSLGAGANGQPCVKMEPTGCGNVLKAVFDQDITTSKIAFTADKQDNYSNFYATEAVIRDDFNKSKPLFTPYAKNSASQVLENYNSTKYYNKGIWSTHNDASTATQIVLDLRDFPSWYKESTPIFKAVLYNEDGDEVKTLDLEACPYTEGIYVSEENQDFSTCESVRIKRINSNNESDVWNQTAKIPLSCDNNCVEITGWTSGHLTKYTGECSHLTSVLLLSKEAVVTSGDNPTATLYGYLKLTDCPQDAIVEYGFYYCASPGCIPTANSVELPATGSGQDRIDRGTNFEATLNMQNGVTYGYRAYAKIDGIVRLSNEIRYLGVSECQEQEAGQETIHVIVDGAQYGTGWADNCNLVYGTLQLALDNLESHPKGYIVDGNLQQPIEITVYQLNDKGTYTGKTKTVSGGTGGGTRSLNVNVIEDINKNNTLSSYNANNKLVIKAAEGHNPRIQHLLIRSSRNIEIDGLNITSNPKNNGETEDTALEIDAGDCSDWVNVKYKFADANITIKNSMIGSNGFTGVHATGCSGINFENNIFNLIVNVPADKSDAEYSNIVGWGASAKFFACKNIKFVRNNFMGAHPTLIWLQQSSNALFYNNVFWNTNEFDGECVAVRLCNQWKHTGNLTENIAFFYNTFYLADNDANEQKYDFLRFKDDAGALTESTIYFQYNNCYSYDIDIPGKASSGNSFVNGHYCPNNYWSKKADAKFDIKDCGDDTKNINVSNYVCETSASGPASLIIKQPADLNDAGLKVGDPLELEYIQTAVGTTIPFTEYDLTDDRYNDGIRTGEKWTLGAYEQSASNAVETIYWVGAVDSHWDNRNNWVRKDDTGQARRLTCVDNLSTDLKIVIPQENSTQYPISTTGKYFYPEIPVSFDAAARQNATIGLVNETTGIPANEQVSAGVGYPGTPAKYADNIELEYGAALKGVERLNSGELYNSATTNLTVNRSEWTLVGMVVKPADGNGSYRNVISNDYFLNYEPLVYMHKAEIVQEGDYVSTKWGTSFKDLDKEVTPTTVYAINLPDQYGKFYQPARKYYAGKGGGPIQSEKTGDGVKPKTFKPFTGRFVNDNALPEYEGLQPGQAVLLNNSYPYNIDPLAIETVGKVLCYDYEAGTFLTPDSKPRAIQPYIKPQHGFVFIPAEGVTELQIQPGWLVDGNTISRSLEQELPVFSLKLRGIGTSAQTYSAAVVRYDEMLENTAESELNTLKVIAANQTTPGTMVANNIPEVYFNAYDKTFSRICVNDKMQTIPVGVYLHKEMPVEFSRIYSNGIDQAVLVDVLTGKEINLMHRGYTTEKLPAGTTEGRFYLNIIPYNGYVQDPEDDNVTTGIVEAPEFVDINIYQANNNLIRIVTNNVNLQQVYVVDMVGRAIKYNVSGSSTELYLPNTTGVYIVRVVGDKLTRTEKVIVK